MQIQNTNVHTPRTMRGAIPRAQNLRFATVSRNRPTESYEGSSGKIKMCLSLQRRAVQNFKNVRFATAACTKMYETSTWRRQSPAAYKNHRFTTVSDVRPARSDEKVRPSSSKICISPQFWTSDEHDPEDPDIEKNQYGKNIDTPQILVFLD